MLTSRIGICGSGEAACPSARSPHQQTCHPHASTELHFSALGRVHGRWEHGKNSARRPSLESLPIHHGLSLAPSCAGRHCHHCRAGSTVGQLVMVCAHWPLGQCAAGIGGTTEHPSTKPRTRGVISTSSTSPSSRGISLRRTEPTDMECCPTCAPQVARYPPDTSAISARWTGVDTTCRNYPSRRGNVGTLRKWRPLASTYWSDWSNSTPLSASSSVRNGRTPR